jgi:rod shape-determining protein MreC
MSSIASRHRSLTLFALAIAAQVMFLAIQIRRGQQVRLIRVWAIESVSPLGRGAAWSVDGIRGLWTNYVALRHMREENDQLRAELGAVKIRNQQLESRAAEADRLATLLGFRDAHTNVQMLAARIIGASPDPASHLVFIDRGTRDGVRRDMGVITPEGVVGKILAAYPDTSQVLLLNDKESGVGALLGNSRAQGPVRGTGDPLLGLEYISNDTKVQAGEMVLTSGEDRIFPKDLPVGTVVETKPDRKGPFQTILVKPAARLDGLEEVIVLLTRQEFTERKDNDTANKTPFNTAPAAKIANSAGVVYPKPDVTAPPKQKTVDNANARPSSDSGKAAGRAAPKPTATPTDPTVTATDKTPPAAVPAKEPASKVAPEPPKNP